MTIKKGEEWGRAVLRPDGLRQAASDAELASLIADGVSEPVGVTGGDLYRSLGSPPTRTEMRCMPIDVLEVTADKQTFTAVAHVVARQGWWRGRIVAACNVDRMGEWDIAPRAHPNDGRVDIIDIDSSMTVRERWQARQRLSTGTHVPHPKITTRTAQEWSVRFDRPHAIWVDGRHVADALFLQVVVRADAFELLA